MKMRLQQLFGRLQFRLFVSHVVVALLTAVSVTLVMLLFSHRAAESPPLDLYQAVAFDYARMWLAGVPDGEATDPAVDPMVGWTIILSQQDEIVWSRGDTLCRAGMAFDACPELSLIPTADRFVQRDGERWAQVRAPLADGHVVLMQRGRVIAQPRLFYGDIVLDGYGAIIAFEGISRGLVALPIALLLASVITRPQVRRLLAITQTSRRFASGDLQVRIGDRHEDDVGRLARQFDDMADALGRNIETLQDLAQRNADLALQAEEAAVKAERARISRDLHDAIAQRLFSLSVSTTALPDLITQNAAQGIQQAKTIAEMAEQTLLDLRALLVELRPITIVEQGLAEALRGMFRQWQSVHRIHIDAALMLTGRTLPVAVEDALFQITHEALSNVARHAQASLVEISLVEGQQRLALSVSDNGRGFDVTVPPRTAHFGLMSMRERAQMLGGDLKIESESGKGTTLQVTLPFAKDETDLL
ncbi:MAG: HAMP domain-containing protein [Anaerolineae bacterium]|nr:HAMP domain-containing protein [Anaerolineae bacterium]